MTKISHQTLTEPNTRFAIDALHALRTQHAHLDRNRQFCTSDKDRPRTKVRESTVFRTKVTKIGAARSRNTAKLTKIGRAGWPGLWPVENESCQRKCQRKQTSKGLRSTGQDVIFLSSMQMLFPVSAVLFWRMRTLTTSHGRAVGERPRSNVPAVSDALSGTMTLGHLDWMLRRRWPNTKMLILCRNLHAKCRNNSIYSAIWQRC